MWSVCESHGKHSASVESATNQRVESRRVESVETEATKKDNHQIHAFNT